MPRHRVGAKSRPMTGSSGASSIPPAYGITAALGNTGSSAFADDDGQFLQGRNLFMSDSEIEIVVDDPTAPEADSPPVTDTRVVDITVSLLLMALALTLGYDNWRTGIAWDSTGPESGYFPFYLSVILVGASLYGLVAALLSSKEASE